MITVAYVEDNPTIREVVVDAINDEADMSCPYVYHHAEDAIAFLPQHDDIDVILMDIGLPRSSGIHALSVLKPQVKAQFCMFTIFEEDQKVLESLIIGANGYILKSESIDTVLSSIRELHEGGAPMSPAIARAVLKLMRLDREVNPNLPLTDRQYQILKLLSMGFIYKEIASNLNITEGTVKQSLHKIYKKLHVNNRTEAINLLLNR